MACLAASGSLLAASCPMPNCVTYTAQGQFSPTVVSGTDTFKLAGQMFSISIIDVAESTKPFEHGTGYAGYHMLNMTGTVNSGLDPTPVTLTSTAASIELAYKSSTMLDIFALYVPVQVLGLTFDVEAIITAPKGALPSLRPAPFPNPVTLSTTNTSVSYTYTPAGGTPQTTMLTIESGTLSTTLVTNPPTRAEMRPGAPGMPEAGIQRAVAAVPARKQELMPNC